MSAPGYAEQDQRFSYGLEGNNVVFTDWDEATSGSSFRFSISGGSEATITLELVDIFADASGFRKPLPLNSTPYSASGLVKIQQESQQYVPNGQIQYFDVPFKFKKGESVDRPILGGVRLSLATAGDGQDELGVKASVVATFAYYPDGVASIAGLSPGLELGELGFARNSGDWFPFNLIPDFPFLFNDGPIQVGYLLKNSGNVFLETNTKVEIRRVTFFGVEQEPYPYVFASAAALLIPNQSVQGTVKLESSQSQSGVEPLGMGLFQVVVAARGSLGSGVETSASSTKLLLILPWKYLAVALVAGILLRRRIRGLVRWLADYLRALQEFRRSNRQQGQTPNRKPGYLSSSSNSSALAPETKSPEPRPLYPTWYEPPPRNRP
jgi:hypothetical protein